MDRHATPEEVWQPLKRAHDREALPVHSCPSLLRTPKRYTQEFPQLMGHVRDSNSAPKLDRGNMGDAAPQSLSLTSKNIIAGDPGFT